MDIVSNSLWPGKADSKVLLLAHKKLIESEKSN